jgi:hypothetical protein
MNYANILQSIGPASTSALLLTGPTFGFFEFLERIASPAAKAALTARLGSLDLKSAVPLPSGASQIFEQIFGKNHFSAKCVIRSSAQARDGESG